MSLKSSIIFLCIIILCIRCTRKERVPKELFSEINPYNPNCRYNPSELLTNFNINAAFYYSWFTSYSYCEFDVIKSGNCCKKRGKFLNWELFDYGHGVDPETPPELRNLLFENHYVIFKSDKYKKYVIGFPGTSNGFWQFVEEILKARLYSIDGGRLKVNEYIYEWALKIQKKVFSTKNLEEIRAHPDYEIIFTGHSLGGGTAGYFAFLEEYNKQYSFNNNNRIVVINYGAVRFGNGDLVDYLSDRTHFFRVVRKGDFVPHFPFCAHSTENACKKINKSFCHSGRLYLIDNDQDYIYHCDFDYEEPVDIDNCKNKLSLLFVERHLNYFDDSSISKRCTE